jgi:hypothetical protein
MPAGVQAANLYLSWAEAVMPGDVGGIMQVTTSRGALSASAVTLPTTKGYGTRNLSLASLGLQPGDKLTIVPVVTATASSSTEWLLDDVSVYECLPTVTGAPQYVAAQSSSATSAQLTWAAPLYVAPGSPVASYEISLLPAPPGYTGPITVAGTQLTTTLTGLVAGARYQISVRAIGTNGVAGPGVSTYIPSDGLFACSILSTSAGRTRQVCTPAP